MVRIASVCRGVWEKMPLARLTSGWKHGVVATPYRFSFRLGYSSCSGCGGLTLATAGFALSPLETNALALSGHSVSITNVKLTSKELLQDELRSLEIRRDQLLTIVLDKDYKTLSDGERYRINRQLAGMQKYGKFLKERIKSREKHEALGKSVDRVTFRV